MAEETVIIDIEVSSNEAVQNIINAKKALADLRNERDNAIKSEGEYSESVQRLDAQIKAQNDTIRANQKVLVDNVKQQKLADGSLNELRAKLRNATKAYDELSRAEREGAKGEEMLQHIKEITEEVKTAEAESGRFQRNVGNYPQVFSLAGGTMGKFAQMAANVTAGSRTMGEGFKAVGTAAQGFGKQLLALMANPIIALIAGISAVVMGLVNAFKKNDEASTALQSGLSALKPIMDAIKAVFAALATVIGKVVEVMGAAVRAVLSIIPAYKQAADAELDLVKATDRLEEVERQYTVDHAKRDAQISELNNKSTQTERYSFKEREKFLTTAIELEREDLKARVTISKEKLRLAELDAKMNSDTSDETLNKIAQLKAEVYAAEKEFNDGTRRMETRLNTFRKEERTRRENAAKDAAAAAKERANKELAEQRKLQDMTLQMMQEGESKEKELAKVAAQRSVEDMKKRLAEEKNLTAAARKAINEQIILTEANLQKTLEEIEKKYSRERLEKDAAVLSEFWQAKIESAVKGSQEERDARIGALNEAIRQEKETLAQRLQDGEVSGEQYETMLAAVSKRGKDALKAIDKEYADKAAEEIALEWQNRINATAEGSEKRAELEIEMRREQLENLHQMEEESDQEFKARQLEAQKNYTAAVQRLNEMEQQATESKVNAIASMTGSLSSFLEAAAGDNKELANVAKVVALGEVMINQGLAIAKGVSAAMSVPFPANLAAIATVVSSILTVMTTALNTINSAKFATGGVIHGEGTGTSDSIIARVSNGESVINARSTAKYYDLLSAINQDGGGVAFSGAIRRHFATGGVVNTDAISDSMRSEQMASAMRSAMEDVHPVVSVREITKVSQRVQAKERLAR